MLTTATAGERSMRSVHARSMESVSPDGQTKLRSYERLVLLAISVIPLQQALTFPEPFPVRLPAELLAVAAVGIYALRTRKLDKDLPRGLDRTLVVTLAGFVIFSFPFALLGSDGSEVYRPYALGADLDLLWFTCRALLVLTVWAICRRMDPSKVEGAFRFAVWLAFSGVIAQFVLLRIGQPDVLTGLGFTTKTSGVLLGGLGQALARSGTFPNGQELGFFAVVMTFVMLKRHWYVSAFASLVCLVYSMSTAGLLAAAIGVMSLISLGRSRRAKIVAVSLTSVTAVAVTSSAYLSALVEYQLAKLGLAESGIAQASQSLEIRGIKSQMAVAMAGDHPFWGVGAARYGNHVGEYAGATSVPARTLVTVENAYAQLAAEHGVFALATFVTVILWLAWTLRRQGRQYGLAALAAGAVAFATQSLWTSLMIWVLLGYLSGLVVTPAAGNLGDAGVRPTRHPAKVRPRGAPVATGRTIRGAPTANGGRGRGSSVVPGVGLEDL